jgi:hypothetical protein
MLQPSTLGGLRPGDKCVVDDGNYGHCSGQEVIVIDPGVASEMNPPPQETRRPVLIPESGRIMLLVSSTPVLIED